jgi:GWxTD domain-containing protein
MLLGSSIPVFGQWSPSEPHFTFDILSFKPSGAASDSVRVDVYLAVPYRALNFIYAVTKYSADYGAIVQITDRSDERTILDRYQEYNVLESTAEHEQLGELGQERADAEQFSVMLAAGHNYDIHLSIRDLSTRHEYDTTVRYTTRDFRSSYASMSDLLIYRTRHGQRIVPSIGSDVGRISAGESGVFAELYNAPPDSMLGVVSEIFSIKSGETSSEQDFAARSVAAIHTPASHDSAHTAPPAVPEMPMFLPMAFDDLWIGRYVLRTYVLPSSIDTNLRLPEDLRKRAIATNERNITVTTERGIPISESDLAQAIDQLRLIATGSEWDSLNAAQTTAQKRDAILEFWRHKNPGVGGYNRPMQIFYARVQYANDHFGAGFSEGWRSDRGRVYIALGPPDYIDSHPYDSMQKPYEIWQYPSFHLSYTFVDRYMLGDYRVVGPLPAPGTFVWDK